MQHGDRIQPPAWVSPTHLPLAEHVQGGVTWDTESPWTSKGQNVSEAREGEARITPKASMAPIRSLRMRERETIWVKTRGAKSVIITMSGSSSSHFPDEEVGSQKWLLRVQELPLAREIHLEGCSRRGTQGMCRNAPVGQELMLLPPPFYR